MPSRREFLKHASALLAILTTSTSVIFNTGQDKKTGHYQIRPLPNEPYSDGVISLMAQKRFATPQDALRAIKNPKLRFAIAKVA